MLYSGVDRSYQDRDPALLPYTSYEYKVVAANTEGTTHSLWGHVLTKEAPPSGVPAPIVKVRLASAMHSASSVGSCVKTAFLELF